MGIGSWKCTKCGESLGRSMLIAMAIDAGVQTTDPSECPKGGYHDFKPPEKQIDKE